MVAKLLSRVTRGVVPDGYAVDAHRASAAAVLHFLTLSRAIPITQDSKME